MEPLRACLLVCLLAGVAWAGPQGGGNPNNNCRNWCQEGSGAYVCCEYLPKCPKDDRKPGDCNPFHAPASASIDGPAKCNHWHQCGANNGCCKDNCLGYNVCKYVGKTQRL